MYHEKTIGLLPSLMTDHDWGRGKQIKNSYKVNKEKSNMTYPHCVSK